MVPALRFRVDEVKKVGKSIDPGITVNDTMCALMAGAHPWFAVVALGCSCPLPNGPGRLQGSWWC